MIDKNKTLVLPLLIFYFGLIIYTAWVSDDAFITFRSIGNWMHGYGLVYNVGERVQTFTHPLWFLLHSSINFLIRPFDAPFGLNKLFYANILVSLGLSLFTVSYYAFKVTRSTETAITGVLILTLSKAYIDYSTSGLENPLNHLLAVLFFGVFLFNDKKDSRHLTLLSFLAGLAVLNRMDTILIFFPALLLIIWDSSNKWKTLLSIIIGVLPVIVWELFSIFYYGFPFPNTAIAKLNTGIDKITLLRQGAYYFQNSLRLDTITLTTIAVSFVWAFFSKNMKGIATAVGIGIYLGYILYIGGDFMSGRYFSLPLVIAVVLLSTFEYKSLFHFGVIMAAVLGIGLLPFITTIERRPTYGENRENNLVFFDAYKIADERLVYRDRTGLWIAIQGDSPKIVYSQDEWVYSSEFPREIHLVGAMGLNGFRDGPNIHVIDKNGLADPLMARMPLVDTQNFRIGHFHHIIPAGYDETLVTGENMIHDENIAQFYDKLAFVVRGELWNWDRLVEIWNLNTGKYDHLIENVNTNQDMQ